MKLRQAVELACHRDRSPYGERELKYAREDRDVPDADRSPYGERELKFVKNYGGHGSGHRSPYGERELKFLVFACEREIRVSLPVWGA